MFVKVNVRGTLYNLSELVSDQHFKTEYIIFEICDVFKKRLHAKFSWNQVFSADTPLHFQFPIGANWVSGDL